MDTTVDQYGFIKRDYSEMKKVFDKYPELEEVILFGSRAKQTFKKYSDIDLALKCKSNGFRIMSNIKAELEESSKIPYFFDIVDLNSLQSPELKKHIEEYGKIIY